MSSKPSVLVAMSGGVDSSVAASLLLEQHHHVEGVFMRLPNADPAAEQDARAVADQLGVTLHVLDATGEMSEIMDYFVEEYRRGRTPNPCLLCNRRLKFGRLIELADQLELDHFATGHYVRIRQLEGRSRLCRALNVAKDQSYALFALKRENLPRIRLPLGKYAKTEVRQIAKQMNLAVHDKGESQEICFVPDDDYVRFILERAGDLAQPGDVVDMKGHVLGRHEGVFRYTIGQRRGLGIALGEPAYVVRLDAATNTVVLGSREDVMQTRLSASGVNWLVDPPPVEPFAAVVQIRYNHRGRLARVTPKLDAAGRSGADVEFEEPVLAITPGQAAVFYDDHQAVLGGGWIDNGW